MITIHRIVLGLVLSLALVASLSKAEDSPGIASLVELEPQVEDFVPTDEWQEIKPGQAIPPGLWIRMSMETGVKMARNMPKDENTNGNDLVLSDQQEAFLDPKNGVASTTVVASPPSTDEKKNEEGERLQLGAPAPEDAGAPPRVLPTLDPEVVREMHKLMFPKSDVSIMKEGLVFVQDNWESQESETQTQVIDTLDLLEDLCHQIDNAQDLVKIGGMDLALRIISSRNQTSDRLRAAATWLLGTSLQNSPKVQAGALDRQAMGILVSALQDLEKIPSSSTTTLTAAGLLLQKKLLFALSSFLRENARAQGEFLSLGGPASLHTFLFEEQRCAGLEDRKTQKLCDVTRRKAAGIVQDIIMDHIINIPVQTTKNPSNQSDEGDGVNIHAEEVKANAATSSTPLFEAIVTPEWCGLWAGVVGFAIPNDLSLAETALRVIDMLTGPAAGQHMEVTSECTQGLRSDLALSHLARALARLEALPLVEEDYSYEASLATQLRALTSNDAV